MASGSSPAREGAIPSLHNGGIPKRTVSSCFTVTDSSKASLLSERGDQHPDHKSAFVLGLAESQGTLAVVAALLAGFSYSGFCSVTREELDRVHYTVQYAFCLSNALSASMALFVTIVCSLCEQQGRVARSFAVLRGHEPDFEDTVHEWWKSFAQIRTNAVFLFIYSIPVFFVSMACIALIKLPPGPCIVALGIFLLSGLVIIHQLLLVNDLFRARILRFFTAAAGFAPPSLDPEPTPEAIPEAKLNRSLGKAVVGTMKSWPNRQNSFPLGTPPAASSEGDDCSEASRPDPTSQTSFEQASAGEGAGESPSPMESEGSTATPGGAVRFLLVEGDRSPARGLRRRSTRELVEAAPTVQGSREGGVVRFCFASEGDGSPARGLRRPPTRERVETTPTAKGSHEGNPLRVDEGAQRDETGAGTPHGAGTSPSNAQARLRRRKRMAATMPSQHWERERAQRAERLEVQRVAAAHARSM